MKNIIKIICIIPIVIGIIIGVIIGTRGKLPDNLEKKALKLIFEKTQNRTVEATNIYIYGTSLNISGKLSGISKDNFEGAKLILIDGEEEKQIKLTTSIKNNELTFISDEINNTIDLEELEEKDYYVLLRIKLNNSNNYKYYTIEKPENFETLEYYTLSKEGKNKKVSIENVEKSYKNQKENFLVISKKEEILPEDVYDVVIDAGHGGTDSGEKYQNYNEADIALDYAIDLKEYLESQGLKVKLTRDNENSNTFTNTNMYNEGGRIDIACKSKAKYMISLHVNNDNKKNSGFEIYAPCKSNLKFAKLMANKINEGTDFGFSTNETYKVSDGVYVKNYTQKLIEGMEQTAKSKGYEPYALSLDTPYLYTIREVGGIATNAYVDGRNKAYSANTHYNSNYGIECYQIELGYIKTDLNKLLDEKVNYVYAIGDALLEYIK